jgi:replicative DNA helicase
MLGKSFLAALIAEGAASSLLHYGPIDHLFKGNEVALWGFVRDFWKAYGALPAPGVVETHVGVPIEKVDAPAKYYFDLMVIRHLETAIKGSMKKAQEQLQPGGDGAQAALAQISDLVFRLTAEQNATQIADFRDAYSPIIHEYAAKHHEISDPGLLLGWPYLDEMTGGLHRDDLLSMVGRPGIGKTWQMLYAAHHGWLAAELDATSQGESRMFVSMEMSILAIEQRLAAMHTHAPINGLKLGAMSTLKYNELKKGLKAIQGFKAPFWVIDGGLISSVDDLFLLASQLKPRSLFLDGAYLVGHPTERDTYKRVGINVELLKNRLTKICPVAASWQFARSASKTKKKIDEVTIDDIGQTDKIGQSSSLVIGLFEEENVETVKQRRIKILKGRSGETGEFTTYWNFDTMDFSQVPPLAPLGAIHF